MCPVAHREDELCLAAHGDTLGAVVRSINPDGTLRIVPVGGYCHGSGDVEGENTVPSHRDGSWNLSGNRADQSPFDPMCLTMPEIPEAGGRREAC